VTADNPKFADPAPDRKSDTKPDSKPDTTNDRPLESNEIEELFQRLHGDFHWPKPNAESVAAAAEAIHRMSGSAAAPTAAGEADESGNTCSACGSALPAAARFCFRCGMPTQPAVSDASAHKHPGAQHHFHHHYHHLVPGKTGSAFKGQEAAFGTPSVEAEPSSPRGLAPGSPGISTGGRAEAGARKVIQDWAQACNNKHIDDLLELYAAEATIIRSNVPPVRSLSAIRTFFISLLEAGLGDVEMESLRLEMLGEIAIDLGRCKMLVPVAMGKRREERGKYLVVLVRQPAGIWKILADSWSSDLAVSAPPPEPAVRRGPEPTPQRRPR
jgi:ketosteroid isomerase-like protein